MHFQIQEFCIITNRQGQGIGTMLLNELTNSLKEENVTNVFLLTSRGLRTEGFYKNKGFSASNSLSKDRQRNRKILICEDVDLWMKLS